MIILLIIISGFDFCFRFIQINKKHNFNKKGNSEKEEERSFLNFTNFIRFLVDSFASIHVRQKHRLSSLLILQLVTVHFGFTRLKLNIIQSIEERAK